MQYTLQFSSGAFYIVDENREPINFEWENEHVRQGFARGQGFIAVVTLIQWGNADVEIKTTINTLSPMKEAQRVIAVPITVSSRAVTISSVDDPWGQSYELNPGFYRTLISQSIAGEERERIEIIFEKSESEVIQSAVLVADAGLDPPYPLMERVKER
jgi:hypothetical protein